MNERIEKLKQQAGINIDSFQFSGTPIKHIVDEPSLEKFAELIVRECLDVINQPNGVGDDDVIQISRDVKKHFGVK